MNPNGKPRGLGRGLGSGLEFCRTGLWWREGRALSTRCIGLRGPQGQVRLPRTRASTWTRAFPLLLLEPPQGTPDWEPRACSRGWAELERRCFLGAGASVNLAGRKDVRLGPQRVRGAQSAERRGGPRSTCAPRLRVTGYLSCCGRRHSAPSLCEVTVCFNCCLLLKRALWKEVIRFSLFVSFCWFVCCYIQLAYYAAHLKLTQLCKSTLHGYIYIWLITYEN